MAGQRAETLSREGATGAAPPGPGATQPLHAGVLEAIRRDILCCRWLPGERLTLELLRAHYRLGWSPIREAMMRLVAEGLVSLEHNKGFRVAPVSLSELADLMRSRVEIESLALGWSIEQGGVEWEAELIAAFHRLTRHEKLTRSRPGTINPAWAEEHRAFHHALVAACNSPTILGIRASLFAKVERYVALSILAKAPPRNELAEHREIMRAALAHDAATAVRLHRRHIERTSEKVARSLERGYGLARSGTPARARPAARLQAADLLRRPGEERLG